MHPRDSERCTAFDGHRRIAAGTPVDVAVAVRRAQDAGAGPVLVVDDATAHPLELDLRGSEADIRTRLCAETDPPAASRSRRPGRPRIGVVAREVTLLPRHWEWLAGQPSGASATLRRLVEQAMRGGVRPLRDRQAAEAVDRFMLAVTGNLPGHEEASRAFWRGDRAAFARHVEAWPADVRDHLRTMAERAWADAP